MSVAQGPGSVASKWVDTLSRTAILWGVLAVILGVVVLLWPGISILVAAILFGAYLFISGIFQVVGAFGADESTGSRILLFISGALSVVLAVLALRNFGSGVGVLFLAIWIGVGFVFQGVTEIAIASGAPGAPGRGWQIVLGIITVLAGVITLGWPFDSIVTLAIVTAIWLIVIGILQIIKGIKLRTGANRVANALKG